MEEIRCYYLEFHVSTKIFGFLPNDVLHGPSGCKWALQWALWLGANSVALLWEEGVIVGILQRNRINRISVYLSTYLPTSISIYHLSNLSPTICACWRPRKIRGVIQSAAEGVSIREADDVNPSSRAGEDAIRCTSLSNEAGKRGQILSSSTFCSIQGLSRLNDAYLHKAGSLLNWVRWFKC